MSTSLIMVLPPVFVTSFRYEAIIIITVIFEIMILTSRFLNLRKNCLREVSDTEVLYYGTVFLMKLADETSVFKEILITIAIYRSTRRKPITFGRALICTPFTCGLGEIEKHQLRIKLASFEVTYRTYKVFINNFLSKYLTHIQFCCQFPMRAKTPIRGSQFGPILS